jgi:uncharacterized repeat protein (TIGR03803 family)
LWNFGNGTDGFTPQAGLLLDQEGRLYGTTLNGGIYEDEGGGGTVFELTRPALGEENWTESLLASFGHNGNGNGPESGLIMDPAHNLYGTTGFGGTQGGNGTVFRVSNLGNPTPTPTP